MLTKSQIVCNFARRRKQDLASIFGGKCLLCGFDKFQEALEFHHVNPDEKEFNLTSSKMVALEKQIEEAKKCVLLCSNCHKGVHANFYEIPLDWKKSFNEERANELLENLKRKQSFCRNCGKEISYNASYCIDCLAFLQRRVERPSREELKELVRTQSLLSVGKMFGVSDNAIRKWCIKENIPSKKTDINKYSDEEWAEI